MMELLLATQNQGKIIEMRQLLSGLELKIVIPDASFDVEETGSTFEENALLKAQQFSHEFQKLALADDSGLVVDALDGRPGVYSKRYGKTDDERIQKLLGELLGIEEKKRTARFICVMALYGLGVEMVFTGKVEGKIAFEKRGNGGFGYDPVFIPVGYTQTFGELGSVVKNSLSHRAQAMQQVKDFLAKEVYSS